MKKIFAGMILVLLIASIKLHDWSVAPNDAKINQYVQDVSCLIKAPNYRTGNLAHGTGTMHCIGDDCYVLTAAHVISNAYTIEIDKQTKLPKIKFASIIVLKEAVENGKCVGELAFLAEVIRYSNDNTGHDIALLRLEKKGFFHCKTKFFSGDCEPQVGSRIIHCGCWLGRNGYGSMSRGIVSQIGRKGPFGSHLYTQCACTSFGGSSGGGMFLEDGRYVGTVVLGRTDTESLNLCVPISRTIEWSKRNGCYWLFENRIPSKEELYSSLDDNDYPTALTDLLIHCLRKLSVPFSFQVL